MPPEVTGNGDRKNGAFDENRTRDLPLTKGMLYL